MPDLQSDFEACPHGVDGDVCLICQGMRQQSKPCTSRLSDMTCQLPAGHLERHTHTLKATEWRWNSAGHSQCFALPPKPPRPESDLEPCANCGATSDEAELMDGSPRLCRDAVECYARLNGKLRDWVCAECGDEPAVNRREIVNGRKLCRSCAERTAVSESSLSPSERVEAHRGKRLEQYGPDRNEEPSLRECEGCPIKVDPSSAVVVDGGGVLCPECVTTFSQSEYPVNGSEHDRVKHLAGMNDETIDRLGGVIESKHPVSPEQMARYEMRIMSVKSDILSDSEWRQLADSHEWLRARVAELEARGGAFATRFPGEVGRIGTHYDDCYRYHPACAYLLAIHDMKEASDA